MPGINRDIIWYESVILFNDLSFDLKESSTASSLPTSKFLISVLSSHILRNLWLKRAASTESLKDGSRLAAYSVHYVTIKTSCRLSFQFERFFPFR